MKKFLLLATFSAFFLGANAQSNLDFEQWNQGDPVDWFTLNGLTTLGDVTDGSGNPLLPASQETTGAPSGSSYIKLTSFDFANSTNPNLPDGTYGSIAIQDFADNNRYESFSYEVKFDVQAGDTAIVLFQAFDANDNLVGLASEIYIGNQSNWTRDTVNVLYTSSNPIAEWEILASSSISELLPGGTPVVLSVLELDDIQLGPVGLPSVPNVENVVATDIDNNGDGLDLNVTFDVPSDETNIEKYHVVALQSNIPFFALVDPVAIVSNFGIEVTPDGSNKSVTFNSNSVYLALSGNSLVPSPIVNGVEMRVWVYVEAKSGFQSSFLGSNPITLDSPNNVSFLNEKEIQVFPNPANNFLNFRFNSNDARTIDIYDLSGRLVNTTEVRNDFINLNVSELSNGMYIYQIRDNEGNQVKSDKFNVAH